MGKIGEEITQKIKSAVKAKLTELGVEIDNELPDYIMVLVANKKNQEQMEKDLELFLNTNTAVFTSWLSNVLNKLEQVTVSTKTIKRTVSLKKHDEDKSENENDFTRIKVKSEHLANDGISQNSEQVLPVEVIKNEPEYADMDCLEIIANEGMLEEDGGSVNEAGGREDRSTDGHTKRVHARIVYSEDSRGDDERRPEEAVLGSADTADQERRNTNMHGMNRLTALRRQREGSRSSRSGESIVPAGETSSERLTDAREILKRKASSQSSSRNSEKRNTNSSDKRRKILPSSVQRLAETIQSANAEPRIPSLVRVTPRPVRREGAQPNKNLLLRAVADAEKSLASHTTLQRKREIAKVPDDIEVDENSLYVAPEKLYITLQNQDTTDDLDQDPSSCREVSTCLTQDEPDEYMEEYIDSYYDFPGDKDEDCVIIDSKKDVPELIIDVETDEETYGQEDDKEPFLMETDQEEQEGQKTDVCQEGKSFQWNRLGPPPVATIRPLSSSNTSDVNMDKSDLNPEVLNKALHRCRFWPNCVDKSCVYYHPLSPCKMFPLCKYGNQCLFIHPDCKFASACQNTNCNYLHKSVFSANLVQSTPPQNILCKFFPNCFNAFCKFRHPVKNCKFGNSCARRDCFFFHPPKVIPPKELLTWKAKATSLIE